VSRNTPSVPPPDDGDGADATPTDAPAEDYITGKDWAGPSPADATEEDEEDPGFSSRHELMSHVLSDSAQDG
jgi:hypothetical protein